MCANFIRKLHINNVKISEILFEVKIVSMSLDLRCNKESDIIEKRKKMRSLSYYFILILDEELEKKKSK